MRKLNSLHRCAVYIILLLILSLRSRMPIPGLFICYYIITLFKAVGTHHNFLRKHLVPVFHISLSPFTRI